MAEAKQLHLCRGLHCQARRNFVNDPKDAPGKSLREGAIDVGDDALGAAHGEARDRHVEMRARLRHPDRLKTTRPVERDLRAVNLPQSTSRKTSDRLAG